jgi:hypothetical protein
MILKEQTTNHVVNYRIPGLDFDLVYYADDTILFSTSDRGLNKLLIHTEQISRKYGLKLNTGKCSVICMNSDGRVQFADGAPLDKATDAIYLGNTLNKEVNVNHEIANKIQDTENMVQTRLILDSNWRK